MKTHLYITTGNFGTFVMKLEKKNSPIEILAIAMGPFEHSFNSIV
jgi:hypothetical protein